MKNTKKDNNNKKKKKDDKLTKHNLSCYYEDLKHLGSLCSVTDSTRDWIELRMYELRNSANRYERNMGNYLVNHQVPFIHQAPFIFGLGYKNKIRFADFYIPSKRLVIEIDGVYHKGIYQSEDDAERDGWFKSIGIRTLRISNSETTKDGTIAMRLSEVGL